MGAALAERRFLMADQGDDGRTDLLDLGEQGDAFLGGAGKRRHDDDGLRGQIGRAGDDEFGGQIDEGREARPALEELVGRLHENGRAAGAEKEDIVRAGSQAFADHRIETGRKAARARLDAQEPIFVEIQHEALPCHELPRHLRPGNVVRQLTSLAFRVKPGRW